MGKRKLINNGVISNIINYTTNQKLTIYMQLNVYLISNPIISKLSHQIIYSAEKKNNIYIDIQCQLNLFLIYETLKKWIKIENIYIKNIDHIKKKCIFDTQESHLLLTNIQDCSNIISNIKTILPKLYIVHTCIDEKTKQYININDDYLGKDIINTIKKQKIIIIQTLLNNNSIIQLLNYLTLNHKINVNAIKIICTGCTTNILEMISNEYPSLEIYTTQIID
uniref:Uracil phosphoribosyltransferase or UMP pyrophosphorylase n=1 Tax=Caulacanthus okamurae TaxID=152008 RepID=A0A6H1U977_9FLOR|nr:uracil phosphoribosyltransferase or UMP pyrophosphorylase [Caulacanthus okamurae]QIZ74603.1 uracil phosphoribosyltransferase or UMP pyrophosphorylase [Caulacanthus okamurae]